ncbi:MAG TPA: hypothetical protein VFK40_10090, partial [Nitrososphaeraceae archaeon]|nr:hypothetical protein [Nitrososphaeraceae archaeon]
NISLVPRNLSISFSVIPGVSVVAVMIFIILYWNTNKKEFLPCCRKYFSVIFLIHVNICFIRFCSLLYL